MKPLKYFIVFFSIGFIVENKEVTARFGEPRMYGFHGACVYTMPAIHSANTTNQSRKKTMEIESVKHSPISIASYMYEHQLSPAVDIPK